MSRASERIGDLEDTLGRVERLQDLYNNDPTAREDGADFGAPSHPAGVEAPERQQAVFAEAQRVLENHLTDGLMRSSWPSGAHSSGARATTV